MFSPYISCVELERKRLLIQMTTKDFHLDLASVLSIKGAISHQSRASVFEDLVMRLNSQIFSHRNACYTLKTNPISSLLLAVFWFLLRTISGSSAPKCSALFTSQLLTLSICCLVLGKKRTVAFYSCLLQLETRPLGRNQNSKVRGAKSETMN